MMHPDRLLMLLVLNETSLINQRLDSIVSDQDQINTDVAALNDGLGQIEAEVAALKAANPALDLAGLDAVVARVKGDVPAPPAPPADPNAPPAA